MLIVCKFAHQPFIHHFSDAANRLINEKWIMPTKDLK